MGPPIGPNSKSPIGSNKGEKNNTTKGKFPDGAFWFLTLSSLLKNHQEPLSPDVFFRNHQERLAPDVFSLLETTRNH